MKSLKKNKDGNVNKDSNVENVKTNFVRYTPRITIIKFNVIRLFQRYRNNKFITYVVQ